MDSGLSGAYSSDVVAAMRFRLRSSSEQVRVNEVTGVMVLSTPLDRAALCPYADTCRIVVDVVVRPSQVAHRHTLCSTSGRRASLRLIAWPATC